MTTGQMLATADQLDNDVTATGAPVPNLRSEAASAIRIGVRRITEMSDRLAAVADEYEKDGEPGPRGFGVWGWRTIAEHIRRIAKEIR